MCTRQPFLCEYVVNETCSSTLHFLQTDNVYETLRTNDQHAYFKTGTTGHQNDTGRAIFVGGLDYQAIMSAAMEEAHSSLRFEPVNDLRSDTRGLCALQFTVCCELVFEGGQEFLTSYHAHFLYMLSDTNACVQLVYNDPVVAQSSGQNGLDTQDGRPVPRGGSIAGRGFSIRTAFHVCSPECGTEGTLLRCTCNTPCFSS